MEIILNIYHRVQWEINIPTLIMVGFLFFWVLINVLRKEKVKRQWAKGFYPFLFYGFLTILFFGVGSLYFIFLFSFSPFFVYTGDFIFITFLGGVMLFGGVVFLRQWLGVIFSRVGVIGYSAEFDEKKK